MCIAALLAAAAEADGQSRERRLEELTLEELMRVEVTTVAGQPRSRFASPSAVYVITADDIRRSGHRTLAEALRLVPGMFVGRTGASGWVVGSRGLTGNALTGCAPSTPATRCTSPSRWRRGPSLESGPSAPHKRP